MLRVLGLGDNVVDKYLHTKVMYPGGNALNIAVLAKICGAQAGYLGVFGDDEAAKHVYETAEQLQIDLSHCRYAKGENGFAEVRLQCGDRVFVGSNAGGVSRDCRLELTALDLEYIWSYDMVHTSIFSYAEKELAGIAQGDVFLSMDFSDKPSGEYYRRCVPYLDCACISCGSMDLGAVRELMEQIISYGCRQLVLATRGERGAAVLLRDGRFYEQSPCLVKARDTMGAGDSFIAGFLTSYGEGMKAARDFPKESGNRGITTADGYQEKLIQLCLYRAAVFSASSCQRDGTFGFGKSFHEGP